MPVKQIVNRHFRLLSAAMVVAAILLLSGRAFLYAQEESPSKPDNQLCLDCHSEEAARLGVVDHRRCLGNGCVVDGIFSALPDHIGASDSVMER